MNKIYKNIGRAMGYAAAIMVLLLAQVSCSTAYDDSEVRKELEQLEKDIAALQERVNNEVAALQELIKGKIVISNVEYKNDKSIVVTLSSGRSFTIYPKSDSLPANLITVIEGEDGILYWAMYDSAGNATIIEDGNGNPIAVVEESPEFRVSEDGKSLEVSFDGGKSWTPTSTKSVADAVIANIEVVYSDWQTDSDNNPLPLYCIITLADGTELKVGMNNRIIMDYDSAYVAAGAKSELVFMAEDATDFMVTSPAGWGCDVKHDVDTGRFTLTISAPESSAIKSGEAVGEGVAKLVVVFNNGMSAIASIKLSTTPVYYSYSLNSITLSVGAGVDELICGLMESSTFSVESAVVAANNYITGSAQSTAFGVNFEGALSANIKATELLSDLSADKEYTFWYAIPQTKDGVKSVATEDISTEEYLYSIPVLSIDNVSFFDADVEFSVSGSNGYLVGFSPKSSYAASACLNLYRDNKDSGIVLKKDASFSGSFVEFFGVEGDALQHNTTYVAWYLECGGLDDVSTDNLYKWEFTTPNFEKGGNIEITSSEEVVEYTNISAKLSTSGHIFVYYTFLEYFEVNSYVSDEDKLAVLLERGEKCRSTEAVVAVNDKATAGLSYTLLAVAVDETGKFGKIFTKEFTTKSISYNNLAPKAEVVGTPSINRSEIKVECEGAESFLYVYAESDGNKWKKTLGGTLAKAGEYIIINSNSSRVERATNAGDITISGLVPDVKYVVVIAAVDADGQISKPVSVEFRPTIDLGTVVMRGEANWADGKPGIVKGEVVDRGDNAAYKFGWYCSPVKGYTAYTITMFKSFVDSEFATDTGIDIPKMIAHIVENCDNQYAGTFNNKVNGALCEYSEDGYYYTVTEFGNEGEVTKSIYSDIGVYSLCPQGLKAESYIYTTWVDPDGNFHEPFVVSPVTWDEEE